MKQPAKNTFRFSFFNFAGTIIGFSIILLLWQASAASVYGQSQPNLPGVDPTFSPKLSFAASIHRTIVQPDGKIIFIGFFDSANGVEKRTVVRLNPDYSIDNSFNLPPNINLDTLQVLADGKFIATDYLSIYRLHPDGTVDRSFNLGRTLDNNLFVRFKQRSDGKIFAFGRFKIKKQKLVVAEDFLLLDHFGGIESGFRPALTGSVQNVFPLPNGKTILTGAFEISRAGRVVGRNFAVLDENGTPDAGFDGFYGKTNEAVSGARLQPDGRILLYGRFTEVYKQTGFGKSVSKNLHLLRLNPDGSFDRDFSSFLHHSHSSVGNLLIQPDGRMIIDAHDGSTGNDSRRFISRIFPDGSPDNFFNNNLPFQPGPFNYPAFSKIEMTSAADGGIMIMGVFRVAGRPEIQKLIKLNSDGTLDSSFRTPPVIGGILTGVHRLPDEKLLISGGFAKIGDRARFGLARLNPNGSLDEDFRFDFHRDGGASLTTVTAQADGKSIIFGRFNLVNGEYVHNPDYNENSIFAVSNVVVRLNANGTLDNSFLPLINIFDDVRRIVVQPDGKILIGGLVVNGFLPQNFIVRLNADGTPDSRFNRVALTSGGNGVVTDIAVLPDGKILITGYFERVGNVPRYKIARLMPDGLLDESFSFNGFYSHIDVLDNIILHPDGKITVGGDFVNAYYTPGLPRFNRGLTLDAGFKWNQIQVPTKTTGMQLLPDGKILFNGQIGGYGFELHHPYGLAVMKQNGEIEFRYNVEADKFLRQRDGKIILLKAALQAGELRWLLTRIFPQGGADNTFNFSFDGRVKSLVEQPDGRILVAGEFKTVNGFRHSALVRLNP